MQKKYSINLKIKFEDFSKKHSSWRGFFDWSAYDLVNNKLNATIHIDKDMARSQQLKTIIHEFTHFLLDFETGINGTVNNLPGDQLEEKCCIEAEDTLYNIISEYKKIM